MSHKGSENLIHGLGGETKKRRKAIPYNEPEGDPELPSTYRAMKLVMSRPPLEDKTQYEVDARKWRQDDPVKFQQQLLEYDREYAPKKAEKDQKEEAELDGGTEKIKALLNEEWALIEEFYRERAAKEGGGEQALASVAGQEGGGQPAGEGGNP